VHDVTDDPRDDRDRHDSPLGEDRSDHHSDPIEAIVDGINGVHDVTARSELGTFGRPWPLVTVLGTLVVSNVVANQFLPSWAYVPWNCSVAALLVVTATRYDHCTADEIGVAPRKIPTGLRFGGAISAGLLGVYLLGLALPFTRDLFQDDRADVTLPAMLWKSLVVVPFGTVLMEEIAFRGVLPAMFRKRLGGGDAPLLKADILAALLFGLWHVLPSWNVNEVNPVFRDNLPGPLGRTAAITAGVVGTAMAGMAWSWLRNRSGSIAAPALVHTSTNSLGYIISWIVQRA
jgi:membrane protease YdiL (CAAX protease family)